MCKDFLLYCDVWCKTFPEEEIFVQPYSHDTNTQLHTEVLGPKFFRKALSFSDDSLHSVMSTLHFSVYRAMSPGKSPVLRRWGLWWFLGKSFVDPFLLHCCSNTGSLIWIWFQERRHKRHGTCSTNENEAKPQILVLNITDVIFLYTNTLKVDTILLSFVTLNHF